MRVTKSLPPPPVGHWEIVPRMRGVYHTHYVVILLGTQHRIGLSPSVHTLLHKVATPSFIALEVVILLSEENINTEARSFWVVKCMK